MTELKFGTFNVRHSSYSDEAWVSSDVSTTPGKPDGGKRRWSQRRPVVAAQIAEAGLHVVALQELSYPTSQTGLFQGTQIRDDLRANTGQPWELAWFSSGRGILWRSDLWSRVPNVGERVWEMVWLVLESSDGARVLVASDHYSVSDPGTRLEQAASAGDTLSLLAQVYDCPVVYGADFNDSGTTPGTSPVGILTDSYGMEDLRTIFGSTTRAAWSSYNAFDETMTGRTTGGAWIDNLLVLQGGSGATTVSAGALYTTPTSGALPLATPLPSDHAMLTATLDVPVRDVSTQTLVLAPMPDGNPCPRVGITVQNLPEGDPVRVTVWRDVEGDRRRAVRGFKNLEVDGSEYIEDYEAPLGRPVTYTVEVLDGSIPPVTGVTILDTETGWIQDPLVPSTGRAVHQEDDPRFQGLFITGAALQEMTYRMGTSVIGVLGDSEPVAIGAQRMAASGVSFDMFTKVAEASADLHQVLSDAHPILIRPLPKWGPVPPLCYVSLPEPSLIPQTHGYEPTWHVWRLTGDLVRPQGLNILVPVWTYDAVEELWETYDQVETAAVATGWTYTDMTRDPTIAGG